MVYTYAFMANIFFCSCRELWLEELTHIVIPLIKQGYDILNLLLNKSFLA